MKPSSGNHQLGWSPWNNQRAQGSQDKNSSTPETGLDAKNNIYVPLEGTGRIFFLTSPRRRRLRKPQNIPFALFPKMKYKAYKIRIRFLFTVAWAATAIAHPTAIEWGCHGGRDWLEELLQARRGGYTDVGP